MIKYLFILILFICSTNFTQVLALQKAKEQNQTTAPPSYILSQGYADPMNLNTPYKRFFNYFSLEVSGYGIDM